MQTNTGYELSEEASVVFETPDTHSHFFGYYDKSPFDRSGERMLAHRVPFDGRRVTADDSAEVGYFDVGSGEFTSLGRTQAFNWQQGSMLQWLPPEYDRRVIYNDRTEDGEGFQAVIVDVETGESRTLPTPIYAIHPTGKYALTVNFERLQFCRPGYSYSGVENEKWDVPCHEDDGIFRVDIETGETDRVVSTREVCEFDHRPEFEERDSWLEHVMWNPSGTRFVFVHRWDDPKGSFRTRMFTADPDGTDLFMFPDTGLYSHNCWKNDETVGAWSIEPSPHQETESLVRDNPLLDAVIRPSYRFLKEYVFGSRLDDAVLPDRGYVEYTDRTHEFEVLASDLLTEDGHFTWTEDERWLLTDTYPLEEDYQHLFIYDDETTRLHELGRFHSTMAETPFKCDLHPRWDRDEERVVVDSAHLDTRQMVVVEQDVT